MSTVIKVENLSKRYRLGVINRDMLYKDLQSRWAKFRGKEDPNETIGLKHDKRLEHGDEFWALRNVDLEVKEGEILGIIGRNGAGKSTLLKILSQITAPTEGRIKVKGRIASLLEVGTGFHPELTGRENVFLNGAILGMARKEVRSKFDEIVAFAEIDEFIDTPVKRYSSGMYVRLAFAVAAHLDPEILIVDEVLAVGDAAFQQKCITKMGSVARGGRTVILVSHTMSLVEKLADTAAWLNDGRCCSVGSAKNIISQYLDFCGNIAITENTAIENNVIRRGSGKIRISNLKIGGKNSFSQIRFTRGEEVHIKFDVKCFETCQDLAALVCFRLGSYGIILETEKLTVYDGPINKQDVGSFAITIDTRFLPAATYELYFWLGPAQHHNAEECYDVLDGATPPIQIKELSAYNIQTTTIPAILAQELLLK